MLDSTVVCRRALGCEWGGGKHGNDVSLLKFGLGPLTNL